MRHIWLKRAFAWMIIAGMATAFCACGQGGSDGGSSQAENYAGEGKLFTTPTEIKIVIGSHASWPYNENWKLWQYFREATGADLQVQSIPATEMTTKINLMMASKSELPDLLHMLNQQMVTQHAVSGAFISVDDRQSEMPNYTKFFASLPEEQRDELIAQRTCFDGKVYCPPVYGTESVTNLKSWMYRKDIFEKHGLELPETLDELYEVCKQLKEIYPQSYPLCLRSGLSTLSIILPQWQNDLDYGPYYDFKEQQWKFGMQEDIMKDVITYLLKMKEEGLVPPDYLTINTKTWEELVSTDRGFIMPEYIARLDFFNVPNREVNPDFTLAIMAPPKADTADGQQLIAKQNIDPSGYVICNTGKEDRIANAVKLLDWMYSDEASEILNWGKEGETYQEVDGKREFILPNDGDNPSTLYGVNTYGLVQRANPEALEATYTQEQQEQANEALQYLQTYANPRMWVPLNEQEQETKDLLYDAIYNYTDEYLMQFLLGQKSLSEWDSFQQGLKEMKVDELLAVYDSAYKRIIQE